MTREQWLLQTIERLRPTFAEAGYPLPLHIRVSCGWPAQRALAPSGKNRTIGQCFSTACSADGAHEVFVSPALDDARRVAAVLVHELCHAVDNCEHGHGPAFRQIATAVGLEGKMTATVAGPQLTERLNALLVEMPGYPHRTLDVRVNATKQGTRLVKIVCPVCGYTARTTRQWLGRGLPTCPCGSLLAESPLGAGVTLDGAPSGAGVERGGGAVLAARARAGNRRVTPRYPSPEERDDAAHRLKG